tara:strand:+ start:1112 stop:2221 length:1110 start_codon:yes stop_codon:yes gene_type:complete
MMVDTLSLTGMKTQFLKLKRWNEKLAFSRKHQLALLKNLVSLTKSGMAQEVALKALAQLSSARKVDRKVAAYLANETAKGEPLHLAMESWFDLDIAAAFSVNQSHSGAQNDITESLIQRSNWLNALKGAVLKSNTYLLLMVGMALTAMLVFGLKILPQMASRLASEDLPTTTSIVMTVSAFLADYGLVLVILLVAVVAYLTQRLKSSTGSFRLKVVDTLWPFSIYKNVAAYNNFTQLLKLVEWGDTPLQAAEKIKNYSTPYIKHYMGAISERATNGVQNLGELFELDLLSPATKAQIQLASVAETGLMTKEILDQVPVLMQVETETALNRLKHILTGGLLVITIGLFLLTFFALSAVNSQLISTTNIGY